MTPNESPLPSQSDVTAEPMEPVGAAEERVDEPAGQVTETVEQAVGSEESVTLGTPATMVQTSVPAETTLLVTSAEFCPETAPT